MKKVIILIYLFVACLRSETVVDSDVSAQYKAEVKEEEAVLNDNDTQILNATLFKSVKKYYCRDETVDLTDAELLVYGTRAWTFPPQDVNLTLSYPSENDNISMTFVFRNITSLSYQFYLHGIQRSLLNITENYTTTVNLC
ncbi:jg25175 [Pararge aegeria aegeria]|uniref:Jg25175 protein n=1 Tax=Pararge aegeria aegeria TaxID=348720 RepID=A0A8S4RWM0_9NEOP|nr:jg25175 [Pararge aegeria aegeria]